VGFEGQGGRVTGRVASGGEAFELECLDDGSCGGAGGGSDCQSWTSKGSRRELTICPDPSQRLN
jgi:hypothetical protein